MIWLAVGEPAGGKGEGEEDGFSHEGRETVDEVWVPYAVDESGWAEYVCR